MSQRQHKLWVGGDHTRRKPKEIVDPTMGLFAKFWVNGNQEESLCAPAGTRHLINRLSCTWPHEMRYIGQVHSAKNIA